MLGVGLIMVRVVGLGSEDPELKSHSAVELIPVGLTLLRCQQNECQLAGMIETLTAVRMYVHLRFLPTNITIIRYVEGPTTIAFPLFSK